MSPCLSEIKKIILKRLNEYKELCHQSSFPVQDIPHYFKASKFQLLSYVIISGGVGATFAITTTLATKIRDKDDHKSWGIGGAAAGSLFGFRCKLNLIAEVSLFLLFYLTMN